MSKEKCTKKASVENKGKKTVKENVSTDNETPAWLFDKIDKNGKFAFNLNSTVFNSKLFLEKLISYSTISWAKIKSQTHDDGKSKHHFLDFEKCSKEAKERINFMKLEEYTDSIFSFAFDNLLRIVGIREGRYFHVIWYDPEHDFYPSTKKHT